jgi:two-component system LytT family response regulator
MNPAKGHAWDILIVDDEQPARSELTRMLRAIAPEATLREAGSASEALKEIKRVMPDLLLLDIQMPGGSGFDLLSQLGKESPPLIFTTAHEQFAVQAYSVEALDYLLKPFDEKRLAKALSRIGTSANEEPDFTEGDSILLKVDGECLLLPVEQIELIEATDKGTLVHWNGNSGRIDRTISHMEEQLDPKMFFRSSRQSLINLRSLLSLKQDSSGRLLAELTGNRTVTFSRRQGSLFQKMHKI